MNQFQIIYEIFTTDWIDISSYVVGNVSASYGMISNDHIDRVASIGQLSLTLNNADGTFSRNRSTCLDGFKLGIPLRVRVIFEYISFIKFYGTIEKIKLEGNTTGTRHAAITVYDWFYYANNEDVSIPEIQYNKKINDGVKTLIDSMVHQPLATEYNTGDDTFTTIFDNTSINAKVVGEFNKFALSELGYIYLKHQNPYGNKLIIENRNYRNNNSTQKLIPIGSDYSGNLLLETSDNLLLETGGNLLLDQTQTIVFDNLMIDADINDGENLANHVTARSYPRRIDTTDQILYSLSNPIPINAGETKDAIRVFYRDPEQKASYISGSAMINPVVTTDFLMYSNSDGTGTNMSGSLVVNASFNTNDANIILTNNAVAKGYVTKLNLRGKGIYTFEYVDVLQQSGSSINTYGIKKLLIDQKYQNDVFASTTVAQLILTQDSEPKVNLNKIYFLASTVDLKHVFLYHGIGDLVYVKESQTGIDQSYYIQGVEFTILPGGNVYFGFVVKEALSLGLTFWYLGDVGSSELGETTILGY